MDPKHDKLRKTVFAVTRFVGSPRSVAIHTIIFAASFALVVFGAVELDRMLLVLTTLVSLEAIYLSLFIQMTVNYQGQTIEAVEQDIDEIQEDIEEIVEDDREDEAREAQDHKTLEEIRSALGSLMQDIERLQNKK